MDNIAKFCKMMLFEQPGKRVIVLLGSGNLAGTQAVLGVPTSVAMPPRERSLSDLASEKNYGGRGLPMPFSRSLA